MGYNKKKKYILRQTKYLANLLFSSSDQLGTNSSSLQHLSREGGSGPAALSPDARSRGQQAAGRLR